MRRITILFFTGIVLFMVSFFFWGSSANWKTIKHSHFGEQISVESSQAIRPNSDTFSIVTYNIGYLSGMTNNKAVDRTFKMFEDNLLNSVKLFKNINPDFVAFQEIDFDADRSFNVNQMQELSSQISFNYSAMAVNWDKRYVPFPYWPISQQFGKVISGQSVLSQYEIYDNTFVTLVKPEGNPFYYNAFYIERLAQITKIHIGQTIPNTKSTEEKSLIIINVHLEAFSAETRDIQIKTVLNIYDTYAIDHPVILCGDFNSTPPGATNPWQADEVIETILAHTNIEMAIGMEENQKNESHYYTFNSEQPDRRIDYFFYNPSRIKVVNTRVLNEAEQISDHLPVWMKFVLL